MQSRPISIINNSWKGVKLGLHIETLNFTDFGIFCVKDWQICDQRCVVWRAGLIKDHLELNRNFLYYFSIPCYCLK